MFGKKIKPFLSEYAFLCSCTHFTAPGDSPELLKQYRLECQQAPGGGGGEGASRREGGTGTGIGGEGRVEGRRERGKDGETEGGGYRKKGWERGR